MELVKRLCSVKLKILCQKLKVLKSDQQGNFSKNLILRPFMVCNMFFRTVAKNDTQLLFSRLSAGLLRQASYTTTRLGVFTSLMEKFKK